MLLENIAIGKTLEIYIDREGYRYHLVSKVEQTGVRRIFVTAITANGRAFLFHPEDDIKIVYRDEEQMWEWPKVKAGLAKLEGAPVHYFDIVNKGNSFNRRNAYRVDVNEEVEFGYYDVPNSRDRSSVPAVIKEEYQVIVDENGKEIESSEESKSGKLSIEKRYRIVPAEDVKPHMVKAHLKDISENGLGLFCNERLSIDDGFFVEIPSSYGKLMTRAKVVRMDDRSADNRRYRYYYGCTYTESDKRLMKYIFEIQRKRIKNKREQKLYEEAIRERRRDDERAQREKNEQNE